MNAIFKVAIIVTIILSIVLISENFIPQKDVSETFERYYESKYQGPVPQGCDEEYFRDTGITKCPEETGYG